MLAATEAAARPRALIVGADPALAALIEEWLEERGCSVLAEGAHCGGRYDFIVLDVPYVRVKGLEQVREVAERYPGTPIIALSSSFFTGVDCTGAVARSLGADSVLPKPLAREALLAAVHRLLQRAA
jgi:DNA-binding response OmpR family regulator